jgi:hypothetical protein
VTDERPTVPEARRVEEDVARVLADRAGWAEAEDADTPRWEPGFETVRQSRA